jgi:hypothetical protein
MNTQRPNRWMWPCCWRSRSCSKLPAPPAAFVVDDASPKPLDVAAPIALAEPPVTTALKPVLSPPVAEAETVTLPLSELPVAPADADPPAPPKKEVPRSASPPVVFADDVTFPTPLEVALLLAVAAPPEPGLGKLSLPLGATPPVAFADDVTSPEPLDAAMLLALARPPAPPP